MTAARTAAGSASALRADAPARVVHVITALGTGGAERQLQWLVARSRQTSATVALYGGGPVAEAMSEDGARVQVLDLAGAGKVRGFLQLVAHLRRERPDIVHVHLLAAQLWGIPAARLARVPVVIASEHSLMDDTIENRPLTPLLRRVYRGLERLATHTIAVSETTRARMLGLGVRADRITVVDNGIDFDGLRFDPAARARVRAEWDIPADAEVIGGVGRLEPVKRFPSLLRAMAADLAAGRCFLVLAGDGPQRAELVALAAELGVADRVRVLGARRDMPAVLSGFDVLVSPSRDETFGMAVVEGLAAGLPVVYAQCPAVSELSAPPAWAVPLDSGVTGSTEAEELARGVERARQAPGRPEGGRFPVPTELTDRYGMTRTAAAVDELYQRFRRRSRSRP